MKPESLPHTCHAMPPHTFVWEKPHSFVGTRIGNWSNTY
jgi:hypothetical protein